MLQKNKQDNFTIGVAKLQIKSDKQMLLNEYFSLNAFLTSVADNITATLGTKSRKPRKLFLFSDTTYVYYL